MSSVGISLLCVILSELTILAGESFFPIKSSSNGMGLKASQAKSYGKYLSQMNEPRLPGLVSSEGIETYRFTILPTWGNPVSVRIQRQDSLFKLWAKRLDGNGGYDPGKLVEQSETVLSAESSAKIVDSLRALDFFEMRTDEPTMGLDGKEWILEGVRNGKYHVVTRWSAKEEKEKRGLASFVGFCSLLIKEAGLKERASDKVMEIFR